MKNINEIFKEWVEKTANVVLDKDKLREISYSLSKFNYLFDSLNKNFDETLKHIENCDNNLQTYMYPCYVLDLDCILSSNKIIHSPKVVFFDNKTIEKYCKDFPVYLCVDKRIVYENSCINLGSIKILDSNICELKDGLRTIYLNNAPVKIFETVKEIAQRHNCGIEILNKNTNFSIINNNLLAESNSIHKFAEMGEPFVSNGFFDFTGVLDSLYSKRNRILDRPQEQIFERREEKSVQYTVRSPIQKGKKYRIRQRTPFNLNMRSIVSGQFIGECLSVNDGYARMNWKSIDGKKVVVPDYLIKIDLLKPEKWEPYIEEIK